MWKSDKSRLLELPLRYVTPSHQTTSTTFLFDSVLLLLFLLCIIFVHIIIWLYPLVQLHYNIHYVLMIVLVEWFLYLSHSDSRRNPLALFYYYTVLCANNFFRSRSLPPLLSFSVWVKVCSRMILEEKVLLSETFFTVVTAYSSHLTGSTFSSKLLFFFCLLGLIIYMWAKNA